ncbi:MAG: hypothetical protein IT440_13570 [Phycisphaeraceae bacterium]|nr:hypothetical protein [Phycisphaeraceae bacterium]
MSESTTTPQGGSGGAAVAPAEMAAMERALDDARTKLTQLQEVQSATRLQTVLLTAVIVVIMLIFGFQTYTTARSNFALAKMQKALMDRAPGLMKDAQEKLIDAATQAMPTYQQVAVDRFAKVLPKLRLEAEKRAQAFPQEVHGMVVQQMEATMQRVARQVEMETQKSLPFLTSATGKETMDQFAAAVDDAMGKLLKQVDARFQGELKRVENILHKFPARHDAKADLAEMERQFVRDLLKLVDYEVSVLGTDKALPIDEIVHDVKIK